MNWSTLEVPSLKPLVGVVCASFVPPPHVLMEIGCVSFVCSGDCTVLPVVQETLGERTMRIQEVCVCVCVCVCVHIIYTVVNVTF